MGKINHSQKQKETKSFVWCLLKCPYGVHWNAPTEFWNQTGDPLVLCFESGLLTCIENHKCKKHHRKGKG